MSTLTTGGGILFSALLLLGAATVAAEAGNTELAVYFNMDVYDRLVAEDLMQASVILASFAYHAAMRDEKFPRADGVNNGRRWHK